MENLIENFFENEVIKKANNYIKNLFAYFDNNYFFHNYNHSLEVAKRSFYLGKKEKIKEEDLELLVLAGLFHDTGFIIEYDNNEIYGAKIAKNFLKNLGYDNKKIFIIENIILATIITKTPENILEEIIKDADLDNLGRDDFFEKSKNLKKEIENIKNIKLDKISWNTSVLELIKNYSFFTETQKKEKNQKKAENIKLLEKKLL